jgi:hypothetical protein
LRFSNAAVGNSEDGKFAMAVTFDGQAVIVTGGGQRAYALERGRRGAMVVVNDLAGIGSPEGSAAKVLARK